MTPGPNKTTNSTKTSSSCSAASGLARTLWSFTCNATEVPPTSHQPNSNLPKTSSSKSKKSTLDKSPPSSKNIPNSLLVTFSKYSLNVVQSEHFGSNSKPSSKSVSKESLEWHFKWFKNYLNAMIRHYKWQRDAQMLKKDSRLIVRFKIFLKNDQLRQCFSPKTPTVLLLSLTLSLKFKKTDRKLSSNPKMPLLDLPSKTKTHTLFQKQRHSLLSESNE